MPGVYGLLVNQVNRTGALNATPFDPATPVATPNGSWTIAHYGVMIPGLPDPIRYFDAIVVLGTPTYVPIFGVPSLVRTTPADSAWVLTGSAITRDNFRPYSIATECDLAADGSQLRFGDVLTIDRTSGGIELVATPPQARFEVSIRPTQAVSHFAHIPGLYDHWSLLCTYDAAITTADGETTTSAGLCTYEYARARNAYLPMYFFTYQILDVDASTQVLMVEVLGPFGLPVQRTVYVRSLDGTTSTHEVRFHHEVLEYGETLTTPDGVAMRMPKRFTWGVGDLIEIEGVTGDDFAYGMAAGYAGSYEFTGTFRGRPIAGRGYLEWIDRR